VQRRPGGRDSGKVGWVTPPLPVVLTFIDRWTGVTKPSGIPAFPTALSGGTRSFVFLLEVDFLEIGREAGCFTGTLELEVVFVFLVGAALFSSSLASWTASVWGLLLRFLLLVVTSALRKVCERPWAGKWPLSSVKWCQTKIYQIVSDWKLG